MRDLAVAVDTSGWDTEEAVALCELIEVFAPAFGCHVALTGGLLYKEGFRKDCDILLYRIRQTEKIDLEGMTKVLVANGITFIKTPSLDGVWCNKARYKGKIIDFFMPDFDGDHNS